MEKLNTVEEFVNFRLRIQSDAAIDYGRLTLVVCAGTGGQASGSNDIIRVIKRYILENNLQEKVQVRITGCQGFCEMDPFILVQPGRHLYTKLKMEDVPRVVEAALGGYIEEDLIYEDPREKIHYHSQDDIPFFEKQTRTILGDNEKIDPIRMFDYVELGGYAALEKILLYPDPDWIVEEVKESGLRGRGGGGFPTGRKWEIARSSEEGSKYIVCNADEGDPGAYMDRSLLEGNPHAIIEGLTIGGIAIGATQGFVYVRSEYPLAIKHLIIALRQARELGILGEDILGTGLSFDIDVVRGAGAFVCGEETALIKSIEGYMGEPTQRPPYPVQSGIWGRPTCINNVETLANVPIIISKGAKEYAKVGVPGNTGTKIFSLVGKIKNTGLVEVPLGMKISEVVYDIGGGPAGDAKIKAVQTGGPSGGCIPASMFDLRIDFDSLAEVGSIMGSGGMIVMDEDTCMVDVAKYFMDFLRNESCGKCFTCRKGTQRMYEILEDITNGIGTLDDLDLLEELAHVVRDTTMCGLGHSASNPVLSTIKYFREEYERHIVDKRCDAFVCSNLVGAPCQSACPVGTEAWRYIAHIEKGDYEDAYKVIRENNTLPSVCARVCNHPCENKCKLGTTGDKPLAIRTLKRFVTDRIDSSVFERTYIEADEKSPRVAIIGSGPAGLTAAHYLSLEGYRVSIFEAEDRLGGMLVSAIPAYRLPRDVLNKEIDALLNENISVHLNSKLGKDIKLDDLLEDGYDSVFLAMGAHSSIKLGIDGETSKGVYPSIEFLKAFNLKDENLAKGRVGIIGGGNSAIDAARIAIRQKDVREVTIYYRRTRKEMPAYAEEIEGALEEGIKLEVLVSPVEIESKQGKLSGVKFIRNELGGRDASGRKSPVPLSGSEFIEPIDTLIVAISEQPETADVRASGMEITKWNSIITNPKTMETGIKGVFAGGDVVRGPNTVIEAIADGKKAALIIDRYLNGESLLEPAKVRIPSYFIEPVEVAKGDEEPCGRVVNPSLPVKTRLKKPSTEVEKTISEKEANTEARRCLRCDLDFTRTEEEAEELIAIGEK